MSLTLEDLARDLSAEEQAPKSRFRSYAHATMDSRGRWTWQDVVIPDIARVPAELRRALATAAEKEVEMSIGQKQ